MKSAPWIAASVIGASLWGCAQQAEQRPLSGTQEVKLAVSERGFYPLEVWAQRGLPLTLLVTRESEAACAKEIIIADAGIRRALPVRQEVSITFTPAKAGELRYTCCEDMDGGRIFVR